MSKGADHFSYGDQYLLHSLKFRDQRYLAGIHVFKLVSRTTCQSSASLFCVLDLACPSVKPHPYRRHNSGPIIAKTPSVVKSRHSRSLYRSCTSPVHSKTTTTAGNHFRMSYILYPTTLKYLGFASPGFTLNYSPCSAYRRRNWVTHRRISP